MNDDARWGRYVISELACSPSRLTFDDTTYKEVSLVSNSSIGAASITVEKFQNVDVDRSQQNSWE